jgi:hypothetical protein
MSYTGNHSTYLDEQQIDVAHPDYVPLAARRTTTSNAASEKQLNFIGILLAKPQIEEIDRIRYNAEMGREISKSRASTIISELKAIVAAAGVVQSSSSDEAAAEGVYDLNGTFYAVRTAKSDNTRRYAYEALITDTSVTFEYSKGTVYRLAEARRLDLGEIEALSLQFSRCFICGRKLSAKESKARGIGPVCAKRVQAAPVLVG